MREKTVAVITQSGFIQVALRHLLKSMVSPSLVNTYNSASVCEKGEVKPLIIFIDNESLSKPQDLSLAYIREKNPEARIILIDTQNNAGALSKYIFDTIVLADSEESIIAKIKMAFTFENELQAIQDEIISEREKEIVRLVALGKTNKEISDTLFISPHTVITHRKNITSKLGIKTIAGLTVYAILNDLIKPEELA